ncbi:hypothetical protein JW752_04590 [Candidatus Peregrinibacteria bacterium]|nr:hypothetical protein [Candidatus Peregrinibacteria bacterium]
MNFRRIKHMLLRLSPEEKVAGIGAIIVLVSTFLPWFSIQFTSMEEGTTVSGFAGDLGVIGFVVFLLTGIGTAFLMADHLNLKLPRFGFKKDQIILFLLGESAFLLLLTVAIYTKRSLEYTNAEMRFGLYAALIGAVAGTFATFAQTQKHQKKETEAFFSHEEEAAEHKEETEPAIEEPEYREQDYLPKKKSAVVKPSEAEQKRFFYEESPEAVTESEEETGDLYTEESAAAGLSDDDTEDRYLEDAKMEEEQPFDEEPAEAVSNDTESADPDPLPEEEAAEESVTEKTDEPVIEEEITEDEEAAEEKLSPLSAGMGQGDYLTREAGVRPKSNIKVDIDSIKPVEKKSEPETQSMSFYDDL